MRILLSYISDPSNAKPNHTNGMNGGRDMVGIFQLVTNPISTVMSMVESCLGSYDKLKDGKRSGKSGKSGKSGNGGNTGNIRYFV